MALYQQNVTVIMGAPGTPWTGSIAHALNLNPVSGALLPNKYRVVALQLQIGGVWVSAGSACAIVSAITDALVTVTMSPLADWGDVVPTAARVHVNVEYVHSIQWAVLTEQLAAPTVPRYFATPTGSDGFHADCQSEWTDHDFEVALPGPNGWTGLVGAAPVIFEFAFTGGQLNLEAQGSGGGGFDQIVVYKDYPLSAALQLGPSQSLQVTQDQTIVGSGVAIGQCNASLRDPTGTEFATAGYEVDGAGVRRVTMPHTLANVTATPAVSPHNWGGPLRTHIQLSGGSAAVLDDLGIAPVMAERLGAGGVGTFLRYTLAANAIRVQFDVTFFPTSTARIRTEITAADLMCPGLAL